MYKLLTIPQQLHFNMPSTRQVASARAIGAKPVSSTHNLHEQDTHALIGAPNTAYVNRLALQRELNN